MTNQNDSLEKVIGQAKEALLKLEEILKPIGITLVISTAFSKQETVYYFGTDKKSNPPDDIRIHISKNYMVDFFALTERGEEAMYKIEEANIFPGLKVMSVEETKNMIKNYDLKNSSLDELLKEFDEKEPEEPKSAVKENKKEEFVINTNIFSTKGKSNSGQLN
jgi:hypothetical protein